MAANASTSLQGNDCLHLGPTRIGARSKDMGNGVFDDTSTKLKDTEEGNYILTGIEEHLKKTYPEVINGTNEGVVSFPPVFDYASRAMQYGDVGEARKRITDLDQKTTKKMEDLKEKKYLDTLINTKKPPLRAEEKVRERLMSFFSKQIGLSLQGYKPGEYLQTFKDMAKNVRQEIGKHVTVLDLLPIEKNILEVLNIKVDVIKDWVDVIMQRIDAKQNNPQAKQSKDIAGDTIWDALMVDPKKGRETQRNILKKKILKNQVYGKRQVRSILTQSEFLRVSFFDDEFDNLLILPKERLIINTEVKKQMKSKVQGNNKQAHEGSTQLQKREEYIKHTFDNLLQNGWRYVKVLAIYGDGSFNKKKCLHCSSYILTDGTPQEEEQEMQDLWKALTGKIHPEKETKQRGSEYQEFAHLFSRFVGLSGLGVAIRKIGAYYNMMGDDAKGVSAGWTPASPLKYGNEKDVSRYGDMMGRPHDIYKLIFFNQSQLGLLSMDHRNVVFLDDYGAGKQFNPSLTPRWERCGIRSI